MQIHPGRPGRRRIVSTGLLISAERDALGTAVEIAYGWFPGPSGPLFGALHRPRHARVTAAVVMCPSLQFEYYSGHRSLRLLADRLAAGGVAALRFDYSGTGDSQAEASTITSAEDWVADIDAAVAFLRSAGSPLVGTLGMRMGATLAAESVRPVDFRVVWDPCLSGRRYLREVTLLARTLDEGTDPLGPEIDDRRNQMIGFEFPDGLADSLAAVRMGNTGPVPVPTLLLTRDGALPPALDKWDSPLLDLDEAKGQDELLLCSLHLSVPPIETIDTIAAWCRELGSEAMPLTARLDVLDAIGPDAPGFHERVVRFGQAGLFGVITDPIGPARLTLVLLNSGAQHRVGPNRFYVELARRLAGHGVRTLRVDITGVGDGPLGDVQPAPVYSPTALDDVSAAISYARAGGLPVAVAGLCSGGYHALEAAAAHPVVGVYAVHPLINFGSMNNHPELVDSRRRIWVRDRAWVRPLNRSHFTRRVRLHIPQWVWSIADRLKLQAELSSGIRALAQRGDIDVVVVKEPNGLADRRTYALTTGTVGRLRTVASHHDHSLLSPRARAEVADDLVAQVVAWADDATRTGCGSDTGSGTVEAG